MSILGSNSILGKPPSGGAKKFTDLEDTPNTYVGKKGQLVAVSEDETALEFVPVLILNGNPDE